MNDGSASNSFKEPRIKGWRHLCVGELLVWIGITIKMGVLGRARASHYWSKSDDFGSTTIGCSMKKNRYNQIAANLSFAPRGAAKGWEKIKWLDELLRKKCREACGIARECAVDESMIKCLCKHCPWLSFMPNKPIKWGINLSHTLSMHCSNPHPHHHSNVQQTLTHRY